MEEPGDEDFNRDWARHLVRRALDRLKEDCAIRGKPWYDVLHMNLNEGIAYPKIAKILGKTEHDVAYYVRQAKARLKRLIADEVAEYCSSTREYNEELRALSDHLFEKTGE